MRKEAKILFIYDPEIDSSAVFANTLRKALAGWNVTASGARLTTLLFETRKYNIVHLFMPVGVKASKFIHKLKGKTKIIHTLLSAPQEEDYKNLVGVDCFIVFSDSDRKKIRELMPGTYVELIHPTVELPDINILQPSSELRQQFEVGERLLALALNDVTNKQQFDFFLYIAREYNRRNEFRLLIPRFQNDDETIEWRKKLQAQINVERLQSTTLIDVDIDLHSLIDCTDVALNLQKQHNPSFDFPLSMIEAMLIGKPVLCFDVPPYNESVKAFRKNWACKNIEEFIRESKDIRHDLRNLEQLSTELARYSRTIFSADRVSSLHRSMYTKVLNEQDVKVHNGSV
jgi:glycosyltransferase involved in cell wall biosynthesis